MITDIGSLNYETIGRRKRSDVDRSKTGWFAENDIGLSIAVAASGKVLPLIRADDHVVEAVAVHIAHARDAVARAVVWVVSDYRKALRCGKAGEIDHLSCADEGAEAVCAAEYDVRPASRYGCRRAQDQVGQPIAVHVAGIGDAVSGMVASTIGLNDEALRRGKAGQVDGRSRRCFGDISDSD